MDDSVRTGDERIPPGQYKTAKWPVLTFGPTPEVDLESFELRIFGALAEERRLSWGQLSALPRVEIVADFHCVTRFSTIDNPWSGFATRALLASLDIDPDASHVMAHCAGGYTTNLPLEDFLSERALVADRHGGAPLAPDHGGPLRLVVPHLYAWKSAKWLTGLELMTEDRRGFWEQNGYHTYGDPWAEQRFSDQETREAHQVRRRARELGLTPGRGTAESRPAEGGR